MYAFGIAVLLGLAVMVVAASASAICSGSTSSVPWSSSVSGSAGAWATGFDLWALWGISSRVGWLGTTLTGVILGGIAYAWHVILTLFAGVSRKVTDEAATLEQSQLRAA